MNDAQIALTLVILVCSGGLIAGLYLLHSLKPRKPAPVAPGEWDFNATRCGNCKYWPLSGYYAARASEGGKPDGQGGNQCDGSQSDCRACLPGVYQVAGYAATRWPQVKREDWCKEFELRDWSELG